MAVTEMLSKREGEALSPKKKGRAKIVIVVVVVVAAIFGAAWFLLRPAAEDTGPEPGEVLALDSIQINLAGGHYLRVGVALQLTASAQEAEGSKALDATIDLFSGRSMDELALPDQREELKKDLLEDLDHAYHGDVMGVYFTDFVTQ